MSTEAMKLAIKVLKTCRENLFLKDHVEHIDQTIKALEAALAKQEQGEPVGFCKVLTMDDVADIIVNAQSRTPPYEISCMTVMQLTEKAVLEKFK